MPGITGIARGHAEAGAVFFWRRDLFFGLEANFVDPPQPFMPSVSSIGNQWVVGIAFNTAQALACLPAVNCSRFRTPGVL